MTSRPKPGGLDEAAVARGVKRLIAQEHLGDLDKLLIDRAWDEVPFVSRFSRLKFLGGADALTKSRVLVVHAVRHLDEVLRFRDAHRPGVFVMMSITHWDNLNDDEGDPLVPCFWISTQPERDLVTFRMKPAASAEAKLVSGWLDAAGLLADHEVLDGAVRNAEIPRVYVVRRADARVAPIVER